MTYRGRGPDMLRTALGRPLEAAVADPLTGYIDEALPKNMWFKPRLIPGITYVHKDVIHSYYRGAVNRAEAEEAHLAGQITGTVLRLVQGGFLAESALRGLTLTVEKRLRARLRNNLEIYFDAYDIQTDLGQLVVTSEREALAAEFDITYESPTHDTPRHRVYLGSVDTGDVRVKRANVASILNALQPHVPEQAAFGKIGPVRTN